VYFSAYSMYSPRPWVSKQRGKNTQSGVLPRFHEFVYSTVVKPEVVYEVSL